MANNYVLLERIELNASAASVTFANIPQSGYTDLKIVVSGRTNTVLADGGLALELKLNNTSYSSAKRLQGSGSAASSDSYQYSNIDGSDYTASTFGNTEFYIPNYAGSTAKSVSVDSVSENNATGAYSNLSALLWSSTSAVTSVVLVPISGANFVQYSTFSLYGLAAVGTTPAIAPKASGGNRIDYDGTYWIHTFNTSGTFTPFTSLTCDYLVVAGGGGGASGGSPSGRGAGGGGAGGMLSGTSFALSNAVTVTVGSGGTGATAAFTNGASGTNSGFSSITAIGGGYGGAQSQSGGNGGSGGGSGNIGGAGGTATSGQGNNGGAGSSGEGSGSGGGGKGSSGQAGTEGGQGGNAAGGSGGSGSANSYSGTSVTYAAGGRGGNQNQTSSPGAAGVVNTGNGGGGGAGTSGAVNVGGNGGSGIVIIRYPV